MRKTGLLILLVAALIGCPPPGEDEIFNNINIADWVTFADGDSISSVTQSFTVAAEKDGYTATVKAPSTMTVEGNTVSVNPINIYAPSQEAILTITLTKDGVSKQFPLTVTLKRTLGSMPVEELILFEESLDTIDGVTKNFTLAQDTGDWGEDISWKFDTDSANLQYNDSTGEVTVTLTDEQQKATATATFTKEGFETVTKTYEITVLTQNEGFSWTPDSLTDYITLGNGGKDYLWRIRDNFTLQTSFEAGTGHDAGTITWTSSNEAAISVSGGTATVTRALDSQKVTLTAAFAETGRRPKEIKIDVLVMETIPATLTVDGKTYNLVYFDAFDNQAILEANWDIGNPGYDANAELGAKVGNDGGDPFFYESPDGQFQGYGNELHKQPTWSPHAVEIKDGKARLQIKYTEATGGIIGAIHSYRRFPHGLFIARWTEKREKTNHWDAFWLDTNHPFSKAYGKKILNLPKALRNSVEEDPTLGEGFFNNEADNIAKGSETLDNAVLYQADYDMVTSTTTDAESAWNFTLAQEMAQKGRFYNAEQRYELDIFELPYANDNPNIVIHLWHFMRGYPSNIQSKPKSVGNVARNVGKLGLNWHSVDFTSPDVESGKPFSFSCLYNDEKIAFYHSGSGEPDFSRIRHSKTNASGNVSDSGPRNNDDANKSPMPWPNDEFNPVEVKFSIEPGSGWADTPSASEGDWYKKGNIDYMDLEYFAYYAAEDDMFNPNIGDENNSVPLTAITDMDNVQEDNETQAKLTKEWVQE